MAYKPMEESDYLAFLKIVKWHLEKGGIDYNLYDDKSIFVCTIKISHSKGKKREITNHSVHKTKQKFKERGLTWPPTKKK